MNDPIVTIGGRAFLVPEFSIWAQRKVSPALLNVASHGAAIADPVKFGELLDTVYLALTTETKDGSPDGEKVNAITKDEFERLKMKALSLATEVLPTLLRQAGLTQSEAVPAAGGAAAPDSPLPGATTSTTSSPTSS